MMKKSLHKHFEQSKTKKAFAENYFHYLIDLIRQVDTELIEAVISEIEKADQNGNTIYFIGNGGSASSASHYANDLGIGTRAQGLPPIRAISLTDNMAAMTALANDEGYDMVFIRQLEPILKQGDVVFALSVSGNSENIVKAVAFANRIGAVTIGLTGFGGGKLKSMTDISLYFPTYKGEYGPVEDVFSIIGHLIYSYLKMNRRNAKGLQTVIQSVSQVDYDVKELAVKGM
jgi:D-sedoheptulose 7-phosphate isomerase